MKKAIIALVAAPVIGAAVLASPAFAQASPQISQPSREQVTPPVPDDSRAQSTVSVDASGAIERAACPLENSDVVTDITEVQFTGPGGAPLPPQIQVLMAGVGGAGAGQPIKVVCDIRDRANAALRRAKYVASVQVPPQRIENGVLRLEVITARIVEMRVRGDPGPYEQALASRIEELKAIDPLNEAEAERMLLLAGDVPGLDIQLSLRPAGGTPGDVIGELTVAYSPLAVIGNVQNYNSRELGRETGYVRAEFYGLTGMADTTYLGLSSTFDFKEQVIGQLGHIMTIDNAGTTVGLRGTYAVSRPDLDTIDLRTKSFIAGIDVSHPLLRGVRTNAGVTGGFEYSTQKTRQVGGAPLFTDKISALFLRFSGNHRDFKQNSEELMQVSGSLEFRKGLGIFGATKAGVAEPNGARPSRFDGSARAAIIRGQLTTRLGITPWLDLATDYRAQWADKPLLNFDEFSIGNLTVGRGYDPGSNSGDRAISGAFELRVKPISTPDYHVEVFGFYDRVHLWNRGQDPTERNRILRSYGAGARLVLPGRAVLELTYAHPQDKALLVDDGRPPDRVLFSLTTQLVPFGRR